MYLFMAASALKDNFPTHICMNSVQKISLSSPSYSDRFMNTRSNQLTVFSSILQVLPFLPFDEVVKISLENVLDCAMV